MWYLLHRAQQWLKHNIYDLTLTKYTLYHALTGEIWGVYHEDFGENWPRYNGNTLYMHIQTPVWYWYIIIQVYERGRYLQNLRTYIWIYIYYLVGFRGLVLKRFSTIKVKTYPPELYSDE